MSNCYRVKKGKLKVFWISLTLGIGHGYALRRKLPKISKVAHGHKRVKGKEAVPNPRGGREL